MTRTGMSPHTTRNENHTGETKTCTNSACSCHHPGDKIAGFQVNENFRRFDQTNDMFNRAARGLAGTRLRRVIHWLDVWLGYGKRKSPAQWWKRLPKIHE